MKLFLVHPGLNKMPIAKLSAKIRGVKPLLAFRCYCAAGCLVGNLEMSI